VYVLQNLDLNATSAVSPLALKAYSDALALHRSCRRKSASRP